MTKQACKACGASILADTALRNDGLCAPCSGGYRESIEAGKRHRQLEREYRQSPEFKFWESLVRRVSSSAGGLQTLSVAETTYYDVNCCVAEIYNGGFDQFFCNDTGDRYIETLAALRVVGATAAYELLLKAKQTVFGDEPVPLNQKERRARIRASDFAAALDELDVAFYQDQDQIADLCSKFALANGLYAND